MTNQHDNFHLLIASPSQIEHTARKLRGIREGFLNSGSLSRYTPRMIIWDSWRRCYTLHVDPARRYAPLAVAREEQLDHLRAANEALLRAASPITAHLKEFLAGSGYVVVLSDARGCLLEVIGDTMIRRRLAHIDFVPGGNWSEAAAGTNAIGTALADGHVVQLMAAEHYCDGWQDLTCTAAPIRHPFTNEIVGVLDVTGDYRLIRPFLTNSLATAALEIQQQMRAWLITLQYPVFQYPTTDRKNEENLMPPQADPGRWHANKTMPPLSSGFALGTRQSDDGSSLFERQPQRMNDTERLVAATGAVSASLDLDIALEKVAEQTARLLQLESTAVFLFDEAGEITTLHTWSREDSAWLKDFRDLRDLLEQTEAISLVRERGEPVFIDDILSSSLLSTTFFTHLGIHSIALLPLVTARGVIGFIAGPKRVPYHWVLDDVRLGLALAVPSATAIEYARLFNLLQLHNGRTEVLNTIAHLLNTLPDPGQHLNLVLQRITEIMNLDAGIILLIDQNVGGLTVVAHCGLPRTVSLDLSEYPMKQFHELACRIVATGESLQIDAAKSGHYVLYNLMHASGFSDVMAVPLAANNTILGVLLVGNYSIRTLAEGDLALFTTIGQQLGLTLKNAQLLRSTSEMQTLRETERLKSGFIAAVSHDLRSPLTAIRASVDNLLDRKIVQSSRGQEHLLHNIADQASRLGRLVDQLLDLSCIEAGALSLDRDWTELPVLISDTLAKFEELNRSCRVERDLSAKLPLHYVDPDRFVQVLWNLLENASKYASSSSPLRVETDWTGDEVLIRIADRGPGIPPGERERIFQHFYRIDRDRKSHTQGSGLGLAICRGIVQAHGGRIWVEDRPGGGSLFCIALPSSNPIGLEGLEEHELCSISVKEMERYGLCSSTHPAG
jgi:two-component system sensor histidine kinase KdpD